MKLTFERTRTQLERAQRMVQRATAAAPVGRQDFLTSKAGNQLLLFHAGAQLRRFERPLTRNVGAYSNVNKHCAFLNFRDTLAPSFSCVRSGFVWEGSFFDLIRLS
jgi:hypothetical protein